MNLKKLCKIKDKEDNKFYEVASRIGWQPDKKTKVAIDEDRLKPALEKGYLLKDVKGYYSLTEKGKAEAESYFNRGKITY